MLNLIMYQIKTKLNQVLMKIIASGKNGNFHYEKIMIPSIKMDLVLLWSLGVRCAEQYASDIIQNLSCKGKHSPRQKAYL